MIVLSWLSKCSLHINDTDTELLVKVGWLEVLKCDCTGSHTSHIFMVCAQPCQAYISSPAAACFCWGAPLWGVPTLEYFLFITTMNNMKSVNISLEPADLLTTTGCTGTCEPPELIPVLAGILGTRYLYMGDLSVQVFPQISLQVPVPVPGLMQCPSLDGPPSHTF